MASLPTANRQRQLLRGLRKGETAYISNGVTGEHRDIITGFEAEIHSLSDAAVEIARETAQENGYIIDLNNKDNMVEKSILITEQIVRKFTS